MFDFIFGSIGVKRQRIMAEFTKAIERLDALVSRSYAEEEDLEEQVEAHEEFIRTLEQERYVISGEREKAIHSLNKLKEIVG